VKVGKNQTTKNNEVNLQSDALTDLQIADEQRIRPRLATPNQM
jgi:hypothetical protein